MGCDSQFDRPEDTKTLPANDRQVGGSHYQKGVIQPWDAIVSWKMGFLEGTILKYLIRFKDKGNPLQDLEKARHYLDKLIEVTKQEIHDKCKVPWSTTAQDRKVARDRPEGF